MQPTVETVGNQTDCEFVHSQFIDAPPERVFRAFSDPRHLARWWGPDGRECPNETVFREVVAPALVVFEHFSELHHFLMTITLDAEGGGTRVGWRQRFDNAGHKPADRAAPAGLQ